MKYQPASVPVLFSYHAAERAEQRLKVKVPTRNNVDISKTFFKSKTYTHNKLGILVEAWCSLDRDNPVVLIIGRDSRMVMTVLTGNPDGSLPPFVSECYANYPKNH